jgi:hypothetical protein
MRSRAFPFIAAVLALALNSVPAFAQPKDSLLGTWVLDLAKSEFDPDPQIQGRTIIFEAKDGGISFLQKTVTGAGNTATSDYVAKYDGKDAPITSPQLDTVSLKRIDENTVERTGKIAGKAVETSTLVVSNGGKTLTITTKGSIKGTDYRSLQVFDKQ